MGRRGAGSTSSYGRCSLLCRHVGAALMGKNVQDSAATAAALHEAVELACEPGFA